MVPMLATSRRRLATEGPALVAVVATAVVSLVLLRHELTQVPYLNDEAMHEEMVRFALAKLRSGHFPPDSWFPLLNLGSPQYLHYQSLASTITALFAWAIGVGRAFTFSTWLLVSCWPLCIYAAARIFGLRRGAALGAAMLSPFVASWTGIGFEQISYLWSGYGVWSQLWAMWTLPLAWALSWRAVNEGRFVLFATVAVAATAALHFETGYLAFAGVPITLVVRWSGFKERVKRAVLVMLGAVFALAWVVVPLIAQGKWAAVNQFLQSGPSGVDANSYGASVVLRELVSGGIFDWHHLMLVTPLVGVGLVVVVASWRGDAASSLHRDAERLIALLFVCSVVLFFGRPTLGPLLEVLPGAKNLFLRRFIVGVQLSGLFLAGIGAARAVGWLRDGVQRLVGILRAPSATLRTAFAEIVLGAAIVATLIPAWSFVSTQAGADAALISRQAAAAGAERDVTMLVAKLRVDGGGRVFAGDPGDWGSGFRVGEVPVFKFLASEDVDEVGFTLRTASLMSDPEVDFDEYDAADYAVFGVRWLILPLSMQPPVPASFVEKRGTYALWELASGGDVHVVDTRGIITSTTSDLGSFAATFLPELSMSPIFPTVAFEGQHAAPGTLAPSAIVTSSPGEVVAQIGALDSGKVSATVVLRRQAVVMLSVSFDPGWQATVDGRTVATEMVAPALVGVPVGPGRHVVRFVYRGFPDYTQLIGLGIVALLGVGAISRRWKRAS